MIILLTTLSLLGCQTFSGNMSADQMWAEGKKQSEKGEKIAEAAQSNLLTLNADIRQGERLISDGKRIIEQSKTQYKTVSSTAGMATKPHQVAFEAEQLKKVAKHWFDGIEKIEDGNELIKDSKNKIKKNQKKLQSYQPLT